MYQGTLRRLLNHTGSCQVRNVASLLAEPLSLLDLRDELLADHVVRALDLLVEAGPEARLVDAPGFRSLLDLASVLITSGMLEAIRDDGFVISVEERVVFIPRSAVLQIELYETSELGSRPRLE
jgi:hypothetical protein